MEITQGGRIMYEVKAYHCSYCKKYGLSKSWIKKHEEKCFHNPVTRSCATCANFKVEALKPKSDIYSIEIPLCLEGIRLIESNKWKLQTNCPKWAERPEDEVELALYQQSKNEDVISDNIDISTLTDMPF